MSAQVATPNAAVKDSLVVCKTNQGVDLRASLLRMTRLLAVIEVYNPSSVLRLSEVLTDFQIILNDRTFYAGKAVVRNVVNAGLTVVCEVSLNENSWRDVEFNPEMTANGQLREEFCSFIEEWQKLYRVVPEYKVIIADMQTFLMNLRLWLDQVELGIRSLPSGDRWKFEQTVTDELAESIIPAVNGLFEKFETIAEDLEQDLRPAHRSYMRRQLHPLVLCAPFAYRAFHKPLGYAGDYEMVNMIGRNAHEGGSLFAKIVNTWFLRQPPAQAHRNRIAYLTRKLVEETLRVSQHGRETRVYNFACGPALEVQRFLLEHNLCDRAHLTLVDFNEETLQHARQVLEDIRSRRSRRTQTQYVRKSVHHLLKESGRSIERPRNEQYDLVYCAGLFDYLSDQVSQRLMTILYDWVAPGGLLVATNVEPSNPLRNGMEHLLDWHLMYRTASQMRALGPSQADPDTVSVRSDDTGFNMFLEVRKPNHV